jgi:hypothetical protein
MRFAFRKNRNEDIRARDLLAAGRLDVERGALNDSLEAVCGFGLFLRVDDKIFEFSVKILNDCLAQRIDVDAAGAQDRGRINVVNQRKQEMLEGRVFMTAFVRERERSTKGLF